MELPSSLFGSWRSISSTIPEYLIGSEVLSLRPEGKHSWERSPALKPFRTTAFILEPEGTKFRMRLDLIGSVEPSHGYLIEIQVLNSEEIVIIPPHGHRTTFKRM